MRLFAGFAAALVLMTGAPAMAQSTTAYEVVATPAANRGQVVDTGGVRTFTAENGWYTMTLGPDDTTDVDQQLRFFTYGLKDRDHYVDVAVASDVIQDESDVLPFDEIQTNIAEMLVDQASFLDGITVTERKVLTLGNGNGKKPARLAVWIGTDANAPGTVTVIGGTLLPKGSLMVMIDCNNAADAEAVLRDRFRIGQGALE